MTHENSSSRPLYSQIDVAQSSYSSSAREAAHSGNDQTGLLRELLAAQDRQNALLEELVGHMVGAQKQRATELGQWKQANPQLARRCRSAAEALGRIQTEFLENLTEEIAENHEVLADGEFMLNEFVDRFGPRMAHLNGLLQVLSQLSAATGPPTPPKSA